MASLDEARRIINEVDAEMARLFEKRMRAAEMVAEYKKERGLPILDAAREREVIARNSELVGDEVLRSFYVSFLENTMATSRAYQDYLLGGMRVAYAGIEGAFAHLATEKLFPTAQKIAFADFSSAYGAVQRGECDVCVLPVENSYNGEVGAVTDLMFSGPLYISGMLELPVTQDLLVLPGATLDGIRKVISHPQALAQCGKFIEDHGLVAEEYSNTALAAKYVSELADPTVAAIASESAAEVFGLQVLERSINNQSANTTRFAVFTRTKAQRPKDARGVHSILLFTVRNEAGSLARAIDVVGRFGFNMRTLRSRPMKDLLWQYYFYVECEGNIESEVGGAMLLALSPYCDKMKVVGTFT